MRDPQTISSGILTTHISHQGSEKFIFRYLLYGPNIYVVELRAHYHQEIRADYLSQYVDNQRVNKTFFVLIWSQSSDSFWRDPQIFSRVGNSWSPVLHVSTAWCFANPNFVFSSSTKHWNVRLIRRISQYRAVIAAVLGHEGHVAAYNSRSYSEHCREPTCHRSKT